MGNKLVKLVAILWLAVPVKSMARVIYYGKQTVTVPIVYGASDPTLFKFPSDVKTVSRASRFSIQPADQDNPSYSTLSITPIFSSGDSVVVFILADGSTLKLKLSVVTRPINGKTDAIYEFQPMSHLLDNGDERKAPVVNEFDLLKAMIRGDEVSGYRYQKVSRPLPSSLSGLKVTLEGVYSGGTFNGYIYRIENVSYSSKFEIDITQLRIGRPNLAVVSSVDRQLVTPEKGETDALLKVVAKPSSTESSITLPVAMRKKEAQ